MICVLVVLVKSIRSVVVKTYKIKYKYINYAYNRRTGQEYKCKRKGIREKEEIVVSSDEENIICEITDIERIHKAFNYFESYIESDDYKMRKWEATKK